VPRYVILEHDHPELHWDLMLEAGDVLRTWRLAAPPALDQEIPAKKSFDHRLLYLDFEGPISGGRGKVKRWDAGQFSWLEEAPGKNRITLEGKTIQGAAHISQDPEGNWIFRVWKS